MFWEHPPESVTTQTEEKNKNKSRRISRVIYNFTTRLIMILVKPNMIFGLSQEISFAVTTWNPESNCTCREKNHSLFHWNILTLPELLTLRWIWCRRNILTISGTLMEQENNRMHGRVSQDSSHWMRNHLKDRHGPVRGWRENRRLQDPTMYGQMCGNTCLMHQNVRRNKSGLSRNRSSIMPEGYVVFISSILRMKNSRKPWKMIEKKGNSEASSNAL